MTNLFGKTIQLYTTPRCGMNCGHCSSKLLAMPVMSLRTFEDAIKGAKANGAERIELFANDPLLHPEIEEQIELLNKSGLEYAILTVGESENDSRVNKRFFRVMEKADREKGGFVFSVDFIKETALKIWFNDSNSEFYSYAFKARVFWNLASLFQEEKIPVRVNTVISRYNVNEAAAIMRRAAKMGFAVSFCFVQNRMPKFDKLSLKGLTPRIERRFNGFMKASGLLNNFERKQIISKTREIIASGELENKPRRKSPFNCFRGSDRKKGEIPKSHLVKLRQEILNLKSEMPNKILPDKNFISRLGERGLGCIELLRQGQFPQIKIGSQGQMLFCCDLHDPYTSSYSIDKLCEPEIKESFLKMVRTNPYIWLCLFFNQCDFSVNYVNYNTASE